MCCLMELDCCKVRLTCIVFMHLIHLRSAVSFSLAIPATRRSTIDDCSLVVAAASVWNKLPQEMRLHYLFSDVD